MFDTLSSEIYNTREVTKSPNPTKFEKRVRTVTHVTYWTVLLGLSLGLNNMLKPLIENPFVRSTLISLTVGSHQFVVSTISKILKHNNKKQEPKPGLAAYSATLALIESWPITTVVGAGVLALSGVIGAVSATAAALFSIITTVVAIGLEYAAFRLIWPPTLLKNTKHGTATDDWTGVRKAFDLRRVVQPLKLPEQPKTATEYVGQIFGIIESYWLPVQIIRTATLVVFASLVQLSVDQFLVAAPNLLNGLNSVFFIIVGPKCRMELSDLFAKANTDTNHQPDPNQQAMEP